MTTKPPIRGSRRLSPSKAATAPRPSNPARPRIEPGQVTLAVVMGAHGLGGEVKLKLFTDDLLRFKKLNGGTLTLTALRGNIARFAETADRTAAEALRGTALTVPRADLPALAEGEYYHADLIGLPVAMPGGTTIGHVVAVENFGAGDVIEIERPGGERFMIPMRPEAVLDWNDERIEVAAAFIEG